MGITGEILLMENKIGKFKKMLPESFYIIRGMQIIFIIGFVFLYRHLLVLRSKYFKKIKDAKEKKN